MQQNFNQQSLQYTNPALYMELRQDVENPDLFLQWCNTQRGVMVQAELRKMMFEEYHKDINMGK